MKLASGVAPVARLISAGVPVGLGTDGCASNNDMDLFSEMDSAAKLQKVSALDPGVLDAATALRMATRDGARAIGLEDRIGSIETGKAADIIVVDTRKPRLTPAYDPFSVVVYAACGADVRDVIVAGKVVVRDGRLETIDLSDLFQEVERVCRGIENAFSGAIPPRTR
jgi:5-methylthioadenosine/S-adenosylhomocysteine deaminase